jgi:hypothetical protein
MSKAWKHWHLTTAGGCGKKEIVNTGKKRSPPEHRYECIYKCHGCDKYLLKAIKEEKIPKTFVEYQPTDEELSSLTGKNYRR